MGGRWTRAPRVLGLLVLSAACGRARGPEWIHLAQGYEPPPLTGDATEGSSVRLTLSEGEPWLTATLAREDWSSRPEHEDWSSSLPVRGRGQPRGGDLHHRLSAEGAEFEAVPLGKFRRDPERRRGTYLMKPNRVSLYLGAGEEPPGQVELSVYAGLGREVDGRWRVEGRRFSGDAIALWPGQSAQVLADVPSDCSLRFATCLEPALPSPRGTKRELTFRVLFNGVTLLEHVQPDLEAGTYAWHELELPPSPRARITFEVEGPLSYAAFLNPVIGPREIGSYGERPWGRGRPDIVMFQADTFRADNLELFGGEGGLAPFLDELASRSRAFPRTWSVGTYTLPAHTSMFTGLYPHQAGITGMESSVPDELRSVAEVFAAAGYRTGAITDAVFVSQRFGLAQGFEWFEESLGSLEATFERASSFLEADDGRPLFLFVQSYRTHTPYRVSEETMAERGVELGIRASFEDLRAELGRLEGLEALDDEQTRRREDVIEGLEAHYRGCVVDLDRAFPTFFGELEERGILREGAFVFTSDHGEAFGEHDSVYHGGRVWEEVTRVPLFLHGPGIEPALVDRAASLIDLPRTLAGLARIAPHPEWLGASLLGDIEEREVFVFQCKDDAPVSSWALIARGKKLMGDQEVTTRGRDSLLGAFDLEQDPGETKDRLGEDWAARLFDEHRSRLEVLFVPLAGSEAVQLGAEQMRELGEMGYGGGR